MNYIILNGQNSNQIQGLLISSLPFITKPLIRTQVEEIDGRDGDIITKLGYAAYTKEFTIGLYGDYDIDQIIAFFDSQGTVTFSNEEDKYYNYQMLEQIDFEKLIRFRTATVRMHVQPFKYSLTDNEKSFTINNNLIDFSNYTVNSNGLTVVCANNTITVTGTATQATEILIPVTAAIGNGNYTLSATVTGTGSASTQLSLIKDTTSNSFGGSALTLADGSTVTLDGTISTPITYNYICLNATTTAANYTITVELVNETPTNSIQIRNAGNMYSKPILTITGAGTIELSLNGLTTFLIDMASFTSIIIDTNLLEAYNDTQLLNRYVTGSYDNFKLNVGLNTISWSGDIQTITIQNYSRWI